MQDIYISIYYISWLILFRMIPLYSSFISRGRNDRSIYANQTSCDFRNLCKMFSITLSPRPAVCMEAIKSSFRIFRFLPLSVNASSSLSSGMTSAVESMS